jgi:hypothetical protein
MVKISDNIELNQLAYVGTTGTQGLVLNPITGLTSPLFMISSGTSVNSATIFCSGRIGIGIRNPMACLHIQYLPGCAPIQLTSGILLSSAVPGSIEYNGLNFYGSYATASGRFQLGRSTISPIRYGWLQPLNLSTTLNVVGTATPNTSGTVGALTFESNQWMTFTSAATNLSNAGIYGAASTFCRLDLYPIMYFKVMYSGTSTGVRSWFGLSNTLLNNDDDFPPVHYAAFKHSNSGTPDVWKCQTDNASATPLITETTVSVTGNRMYELVMDASTSGIIYFYINNNLVATHNTKLPLPSTGLRYIARSQNLAATARVLSVGRIGFETN